ncbi:MAG: TauD/TfdA family dioxygenase [Orrella sp.]|uniref:TauD/TfdA dioxygenase family protein n=2 Tax=Orrella sp. TaxID=1921583 RepID=UPI003BBB00F5
MTTTNLSLDVKPIAGAIGAEIHGVDLTAPLSDEDVQAIRAVWLEHGVVFFRNQPLEPSAFQAFAERFGDVVEYPFVKGIPEYPMIIPVLKLPHEKHNFGGIWHTDTAYLNAPPMATMLIARELPPKGGDTLFASGYAAYDALSDGLKKTLSTLKAANCSTKAEVTKTREDRVADSATDKANQALVGEHPVIRTHPETGRKTLYVNPAHTTHFVGWTEQESQPLLEFLFAHQTKAEFTCRFNWQESSIALWDNRCVLHNPVNDYHGHKRLLHRITLKGDVPV